MLNVVSQPTPNQQRWWNNGKLEQWQVADFCFLNEVIRMVVLESWKQEPFLKDEVDAYKKDTGEE